MAPSGVLVPTCLWLDIPIGFLQDVLTLNLTPKKLFGSSFVVHFVALSMSEKT